MSHVSDARRKCQIGIRQDLANRFFKKNATTCKLCLASGWKEIGLIPGWSVSANRFVMDDFGKPVTCGRTGDIGAQLIDTSQFRNNSQIGQVPVQRTWRQPAITLVTSLLGSVATLTHTKDHQIPPASAKSHRESN